MPQNHRLAGKNVKWPFQYEHALVTWRGKVVQSQHDYLNDVAAPHIRGHYPRLGEWFVISHSGKTAYTLRDGFAGHWIEDC